MLQCYEGTRCYKEGAPFEDFQQHDAFPRLQDNGSSFQLMCALQECLNSNDPEYVTQECIWLRKARSRSPTPFCACGPVLLGLGRAMHNADEIS